MPKKSKARKKSKKSKPKNRFITQLAASVNESSIDDMPILDLLIEDHLLKKDAFQNDLPTEEMYVTNKSEDPLENTVVQISFTVSAEFRREYKSYSIDQNMTMLQVFKSSFELYRRVYPIEESPS